MTPHPAPGSSRLSAAVLALLAVALITWPAVTTCADDPDAMPPNVVWIIADDLGWGELSCQNPDTDVPTPQLDRIAESGARFTQAYVTAPFCAASRAGMLTGRYQTRFGFLNLGVGRILDALAEHGVERRTIVVFMSDNGAPTRELTSSNGLLHGEKGGVYDGGLRVPMLVRWPDVIEPGQVIHQPVISLDLGATFLAAAGAEPPQPLDGTDLRDLLDAGPVERTFFWRIGPERRALRRGDWKLVSHRQEAWELFHLGDDPGEQHDRAAEFPERVQTLERTWLDLADEMADSLW